jgi:hypothetical protein
MSIFLIIVLIILSILTAIKAGTMYKKDKDKEKERDRMLEEVFQVRKKGKK